jgi:hypothetical protein
MKEETIDCEYVIYILLNSKMEDVTTQRGEHSKFKIFRENWIKVPTSYNQEKNTILI